MRTKFEFSAELAGCLPTVIRQIERNILMLRSVFSAFFAAVAFTALTPDVEATFYTSNGDLAMDSSLGGSPQSGVEIFSGSNGRNFTNQVTGTPFSVGSEVRTVSAVSIANVTNGGFGDQVEFTNDDRVVVIGVVRGTVVSSGGVPEAKFTEGRAFVVRGISGFNPQQPDTWNATSTIVAEYALKPQEAVVPGSPLGTGSNISYDASMTNVSAVNTAGSQITQGTFLFREDSTDDQNLDPNGGDNFLSNVADASPVGLIKADEAIVSEIDQTLLFDDIALLGLDGDDLASLNFWGSKAFFDDVSFATTADLGGGNYFATGLGSALTDFNPWPSGVPTGDFAATQGSDNHLGHQAVPEPGSCALFGIGICVAFGVSRKRRRKTSK